MVEIPKDAPPPHPFRTLREGESVAGRYLIRRFIARGGMGEVYEAFDTTVQERVALKTLPLTAHDQGDAAEALVREVRVARKVVHPNVCRILELGVHRPLGDHSDAVSIPFVTMEFLVGETLAQRLARTAALPPADVIRIGRELAAGLAAVHEAGIVHRDLKTENVFLVHSTEANGGIPLRTVVMDFGLARLGGAASINGAAANRVIIGTLAYMAPEQLTGQPATSLSDVYALGIVVFEMLTGRLPFVGETLPLIGLARLHQQPMMSSTCISGLDLRWDDLVGRCLNREPQRRFRDMTAFLAALDALDGDPPLRVGRSNRRMILAAGGVVALALTAITLTFHKTKERRNPPVAFVDALVSVPMRRSAAGRPALNRTLAADGLPASPLASPPAGAVAPPSPSVSPPARPRMIKLHGMSSRRQLLAVVSQGSHRQIESSPRTSSGPPPVSATTVSKAPLTTVDPFAQPKSRDRHPDDLIDPF